MFAISPGAKQCKAGFSVDRGCRFLCRSAGSHRYRQQRLRSAPRGSGAVPGKGWFRCAENFSVRKSAS